MGTDYEEDWERLLEIYGRYPLKELIIHPRLLKDHYKGVPRYGLYEVAREKLKVPLGYNGDIFSVEAYQEIREKFPNTEKSCGSSMTVFTGIIRNIFRENEMYFSA